jgi:hypothetical protein
MTYPQFLVQNCEEYRDAYKAAYGLIYQAALALAQSNTLARGKVAIVGNQKLRQEVIAAITAVSPQDMGQKGWFAANRAHEDAMIEACEDAFADYEIASGSTLRAELRRQQHTTASKGSS